MGKRTRAGRGICLSKCQNTDAVWFRWQRKIDQTCIVSHLKTKATNEILILYGSDGKERLTKHVLYHT